MGELTFSSHLIDTLSHMKVGACRAEMESCRAKRSAAIDQLAEVTPDAIHTPPYTRNPRHKTVLDLNRHGINPEPSPSSSSILSSLELSDAKVHEP